MGNHPRPCTAKPLPYTAAGPEASIPSVLLGSQVAGRSDGARDCLPVFHHCLGLSTIAACGSQRAAEMHVGKLKVQEY